MILIGFMISENRLQNKKFLLFFTWRTIFDTYSWFVWRMSFGFFVWRQRSFYRERRCTRRDSINHRPIVSINVVIGCQMFPGLINWLTEKSFQKVLGRIDVCTYRGPSHTSDRFELSTTVGDICQNPVTPQCQEEHVGLRGSVVL